MMPTKNIKAIDARISAVRFFDDELTIKPPGADMLNYLTIGASSKVW